jgi:hypothetical protein
MQCIYFDGAKCLAHPPRDCLVYKPDNEEEKKLCQSDQFKNCARYGAFIEYLQAMVKPSR